MCTILRRCEEKQINIRKDDISRVECIEKADDITAMHTNFHGIEGLGEITRTHNKQRNIFILIFLFTGLF